MCPSWSIGFLVNFFLSDAHTSTARAVAAALRLTQKVLPEGGSDSYLAKTYDSQDRMLWSLLLQRVAKQSVQEKLTEFAKWIDGFCPPDKSP